MKFINEEDLTVESFGEFCRDIEAIIAKHDKERLHLNESIPSQFNSIEEAREYYGSMPFEEWENKMFAKLGIDKRKLFEAIEKEMMEKDNGR